MTVRLYDTRTQTLREFAPVDEGNVTMYVCGPTVQSGPHIGHLRGALSFDILRRWLEYRFGRVTYVRNVTDIDDKVLANASEQEPWWALAYRMEQEFNRAYAAIGIRPPTYEPRATGSIPQMIELIGELIERGHAYAAGGDVYFDVRSWPTYGELTRQSVDAMDAAADSDTEAKRDPADFALWKAAKPGEPGDASWSSPWGTGRPGWHIECSAMSRRYLGSQFDIHGGGLDLRFPHHENELAQSGAAGDAFARFWMHNGLVTVRGQKMSKSLGNFVLAEEVLGDRAPRVVRYALGAAHYRSSLDIAQTTFTEAQSALDRIDGFVHRAMRATAGQRSDEAFVGDDGAFTAIASRAALPAEFAAQMDDDLAVPGALAVLHERVRQGNIALDARDDRSALDALAAVSAMMWALGLDDARVESADADDGTRAALDALVRTMIEQRVTARAQKDWAAADRIRDAVAAAGITLEDTPDGTNWSLNG